MLDKNRSFIRQWDLFHDIDDISLYWDAHSCLRNLHSIELLEYLFELAIKAVMTQNTYCFDCSDLRYVFGINTFQLGLECLGRFLIKY